MSRKLEIDYFFGYVFDKSKLIVMYPAGSNVIDEKEYEMEVEVAFLEDGVDAAFDEVDVKEANDFIKPLEMFLTKPSKVIPFVNSIKDNETKEVLDKFIKDFDEEYEIKDKYIQKGYEFKDVYSAFENIVNYIPKENIENLNILKIGKGQFDLDSFVNETKKALDEFIDVDTMPIAMEKSHLTDRIFVKEAKANSKYIVFGVCGNSNEIIECADKTKINKEDADLGDLEINNIRDCGYIIEEVDGFYTFKITNFISETTNKKQVAQVVDYSGVIKIKMIDFVKKFIIE